MLVGMSMEETLENAINTHVQWVERFQLDLADGKLSERAREVGYDDLCEFGIWLYGLSESIKRTPEYRRVKNLHYDFHSVAGEVVKLLGLEQFEKASQLITGEMEEISINLQTALRVWQDIEAAK